MAEALLGLEFDIHGGGIDLVFPHHENEAAQTARRARPAARPPVDAQRHARGVRGREDGQVGRQHPRAGRGARRRRRRGAAPVLLRRPLPAADRVLAGAAWRRRPTASGGSARRGGGCARATRPTRWRAHRDAFFDALADDFNTAKALRRAVRVDPRGATADGTGDSHLREMLGVLGLERCWRPTRPRRRRPQELADAARAGARGPGLGRGRPPARRAARHGLGGARRPARTGARPGALTTAAPRGARRRRSVAPGHTVVYGRNPVREALRGRRRVHRIWATEAVAGRRLGRRARDASPTPRRSRRAAGPTPTRASAPRSTRTRTPTPPSCSPRPIPLIVALDEVTDPQNLGASRARPRPSAPPAS